MSKLDITGKELAGLLFTIHRHEKPRGNIIYREGELLKILKAIGLPEPEWGISLTIREFKKSKETKK